MEMLFQTTSLAVGTAFFWLSGSQHFLITNWHNLSGKDPRTGKHLSVTAGEPDRIRVYLNTAGQLGSKFETQINIRDGMGAPLWWVHPNHGKNVDVVALPVQTDRRADMYPINLMPSAPQMHAAVGHEVFILGYPFGIGTAGLPIWKRGSIASEPEVIDPADPYILVDTASRPGMSGSPVIRRQWGSYQDGAGNVYMGGGDATRLMGIYSGRLSASDPKDAQLGLMWPTNLIGEIIAGATVDS